MTGRARCDRRGYRNQRWLTATDWSIGALALSTCATGEQ